MIRIRPIAMILAALCALFTAPALAQAAPEIAGDWHGTVPASMFGGETTLVLTVARGEDGMLTAELENRDQAPGRKQRVAELAVTGGKLTFAVPAAGATYSGEWDEAARHWAGTLLQGQATALNFAKGQPAPKPVIEGLGGLWEGTAELNGIKLRQALRVATGEWGTNVLYDSPDQMTIGLPVENVVRDGLVVRFSALGGLTTFEGTLSEDLNGLAGKWVTPGSPDVPMSLTRTQQSADRRASGPAAPWPADWRIPDDRAIGELIEARIASRPGARLAVGVVEPGGQRVVTRGAGAAAGRPVDENTIFEIGSISKVFTALILADMALKGEVSLDDPADKYLPAGARLPERGRKITLRDLAMHLSGLPRDPPNVRLFLEGIDPYDEQHLLEFLASYELRREPGSAWEYSNTGVALLGYLLGRAAGTDYETLLRQRITGPLGMNDTAITLSAEQQGRFAQGHDSFMRPAAAISNGGIAPAGSIRSTAADMGKFVAAVLDPDSPLGPAMELALAHRHVIGRGTEMALGWTAMKPDEPDSGEILVHDGLTAGSAASIAVNRGNGRAVAGMLNVWDQATINNLVLHLLAGAPLAQTGSSPAAPLAAD